MNNRNNSTKNINELVKTATNKLDTTTEKVKNNLLQIISNELKHASKRERELMEWEMMLHIWALFEGMLSDENSKTEKAEYEKQYRLYAHLAKELNFEKALNQFKIHENLRKEEENKKRKQLEEQTEKTTNKKTNQVIGNENNTGNNEAIQEGNWIQVNGNGNVVILWGNYRDWRGIFPNIPELSIEKPAEEKPAEGRPAEEKPAEEKPIEGRPAEEPSIPTPIIPPHIESTPEKKEETDDSLYNLDASLSNVENIHRENAKYKAEEEIKEKYNKLSKYNLLGKAKFFLMRGIMRDKKIKQQMKDAKNWPFSNDKELNSELGKGVNRQELETLFSGENSERQIKDIPELNKACISFIRGELSETSFQAFFTALIQNKKKEFWIQNIDYLGTNILEKLKFEKAQFELVNELAKDLETGADTTAIEKKIEDFLKSYQRNPDFLKTIRSDLANKNNEQLKNYFRHEHAKRVLALNNLKMNLNVFTNKKSAYQIDNSDREKGRAYSLGKKIDALPWWAQTAGFTGGGLLLGLTGGALGLGVIGSSALVTWWVAGMTGFKNYIKKRTHYTKEQNTHEKNMTRNLSNELAKIEKRK